MLALLSVARENNTFVFTVVNMKVQYSIDYSWSIHYNQYSELINTTEYYRISQ